MTETFLLIGGNLGNRQHNIKKAKEHIKKDIGNILSESAVYESEPWGFEHEKNFLNQALAIETTLLPVPLLEAIHHIENLLGRKRAKNHYTARTMDIDILFYAREIIKTPELNIPHKELHKRKFALTPLSEIAPELIHPVFNKSINKLLEECSDTGMVKKSGRPKQ